MTKVVVERLGPVDDGWAEAALAALRRLYGSVEDPPLLVYLVLVSDRPRFYSLLASLHELWGVSSSCAFESFEAAHDAYSGAPRLILCLEPLRSLPREAFEGVVLHEGAHTVLHGSLDAYLAPGDVLEEAAKLAGPRLSRDLAYLAAAAAKDYEASQLLLDTGFRAEARAHVLHVLSHREGLEEEWELSLRLSAHVLHLAELLKPLCCAAPLLEDPEVGAAVEEYTSHLPAWARLGLKRAVGEGAWRLEPSPWGKARSLLRSLSSIGRPA